MRKLKCHGTLAATASASIVCLALGSAGVIFGQEQAPPARAASPFSMAPTPPRGLSILPINLPTAFKLAGAQALDIALASERIQVAAAQLQASRVLWLPSLFMGTDYFRHDGQIQDISGNVFGTSKQLFQGGLGPSVIFSFSDAILAPLAARQVAQARQADREAITNDTLLAVAETYFTVQQARGELAGTQDVVRRTEDLLRRVKKLVPGGLAPALEITRTETELERRQKDLYFVQERWRVASAELVRILRLDPTTLVQPLEPPNLQMGLVKGEKSLDELIPVALRTRPELASQRALVEASLQLMRQEKLRPLVPSLLIRGASTPVVGTLSATVFGGGLNGNLSNFSMRQDWDVQLLWKLDNLGFANLALYRQRRAENKAALLTLFRTQDLVAAQVTQAHAQVQMAQARAHRAENELKKGLLSVEQNLVGVENPTKQGNLNVLLVRPQEVVAAVQALAQAYADYFGAVADVNRAQFRLYRALGRPAQMLLDESRHETPHSTEGQESTRPGACLGPALTTPP